jgi:uncharacterized membrane protein
MHSSFLKIFEKYKSNLLFSFSSIVFVLIQQHDDNIHIHKVQSCPKAVSISLLKKQMVFHKCIKNS